MEIKQKFWNPIIETLPPQKIKQLQLSKFQKSFDRPDAA